ncbi:class IIb bacteriocin, lactobin A/cerein 7B family [Aquirufa aurantiipilula]|uniref:class IIb bacteriocin, lactobin A/cerein 7B family n=1 Tax=Aquirufa aurantiipilula TaxID=2696561 RepID=UPI001CAA7E1D|nr:class IIb bacteriocin, lactobin A/cerein 7B family [Aquirufa aurantiipilula]MBZ1327212.1 class IIb bacteriocin, lactobin A/cerein 7B family [Aquirufa aurantiipilula]
MTNLNNLNQYDVLELDNVELEKTEGGAAPLILVAGAVVRVLLVGALVGYAVYKAVDWLTH